MKGLDEQAFGLTLELAKSKKVREETEDRYAEELGKEVERIEGVLVSERKEQEDGTRKMSELLNEQVTKYTDLF